MKKHVRVLKIASNVKRESFRIKFSIRGKITTTCKELLWFEQTKFIIFAHRGTNLHTLISDVEIKRNQSFGMILDNKWCWKPHINDVKALKSKWITVLYKMKDLFNQASFYTLYCSLLLPYITDCVLVWGNSYKTNTNQIFRFQQRDIRSVNQTTDQEPTQLFIQW